MSRATRTSAFFEVTVVTKGSGSRAMSASPEAMRAASSEWSALYSTFTSSPTVIPACSSR